MTEDSLFSDGCSSHNTAMAMGALGGFLYALAEYPPAQGELRQSAPAPPASSYVLRLLHTGR